MAKSNFKILSAPEIKQLNREGFDLDEKKFYALSFLINDEKNTAADPRPFKVATSFVEELTKTGMGRPWLPDTLPDGKHIRPKKDSTAEEIQQFQKDFAGGIMRGYYVNPLTHNANVIIEIFPEFIDRVKNEDIPPFVSPMIGNWKEANDEIVQGEILHIQSVESPGYDREFAKFLGTCEGDFNECAVELEPLAALGKLKQYRDSSISCPKKFLNTLGAQGNQMPDDPPAVIEPSGNETDKGTSAGETKILEEIKTITTKVDEVVASVETVKEVVAEVAVAAEGVDDEDIKKKLGMGAVDDEPKKDEEDDKKPEPVAASGNQKLMDEIKLIKKQNAELKKESEDAKILAIGKERIRQVDIIIKSKLLTKEIKLEDKEKLTKEWLEKKSLSDNKVLADLSLVADEAEKKVNSIIPAEDIPLASYGNDYVIPDSTVNYAEIEKEFS